MRTGLRASVGVGNAVGTAQGITEVVLRAPRVGHPHVSRNHDTPFSCMSCICPPHRLPHNTVGARECQGESRTGKGTGFFFRHEASIGVGRRSRKKIPVPFSPCARTDLLVLRSPPSGGQSSKGLSLRLLCCLSGFCYPPGEVFDVSGCFRTTGSVVTPSKCALLCAFLCDLCALCVEGTRAEGSGVLGTEASPPASGWAPACLRAEQAGGGSWSSAGVAVRPDACRVGGGHRRCRRGPVA